MFIDSSSIKKASGNGVYRRVLLRESFREAGKVKHRTLGNLSDCSEAEINAIRLALKHKADLAELIHRGQSAAPSPTNLPQRSQPPPPQNPHDPPLPKITQGPSVGAILALKQIAEETGVAQALGRGRNGQLALWQIIARALDQGSRLSAVRLARDLQAQATLPDLPDFDEDALYANLAWLDEHQTDIENSIFTHRHQTNPSPLCEDKTQTPNPSALGQLYLYDVTSTYLEGQQNELAEYGYNRDGKRGKKQIVAGLLCSADGLPVSIQAFRGNTSDPATVAPQIAKLKERFQSKQITLVGDRGMIRGPQQTLLTEAGLNFITAISKPQIETLLKRKVISIDLFDEKLAELIQPAALPYIADATPEPEATAPPQLERYVFRRNPTRQKEMADNRASRQQKATELAAALSTQLAERPKTTAAAALNKLNKKIRTLKLGHWLTATAKDRRILLQTDTTALAEEAKLDGCYVMKTDLTPSQAAKETIHSAYKSLTEVETAFRRSKTVELAMRPVHVRKETSSRGHLFVVMLAYLLMHELGKRWTKLDRKVSEGLDRLNTYCAVEVGGVIRVLLEPRADVKELLEAAGIKLPTTLSRPTKVDTKVKLPKHRPKR